MSWLKITKLKEDELTLRICTQPKNKIRNYIVDMADLSKKDELIIDDEGPRIVSGAHTQWLFPKYIELTEDSTEKKE